jgi:hypothetical protein
MAGFDEHLFHNVLNVFYIRNILSFCLKDFVDFISQLPWTMARSVPP